MGPQNKIKVPRLPASTSDVSALKRRVDELEQTEGEEIADISILRTEVSNLKAQLMRLQDQLDERPSRTEMVSINDEITSHNLDLKSLRAKADEGKHFKLIGMITVGVIVAALAVVGFVVKLLPLLH